MILMIERDSEDKECYIIDDITRIGIGKARRSPRNELESCVFKGIHDVIIMDNMFNSGVGDTSDDMFKSLVVICKKTNGDEFSVMFDTSAYLCNNDGKTIKRIAVEVYTKNVKKERS